MSFLLRWTFFNDGANVLQIPINGDLIDLVVSGKDAQKLTMETLGNIPIIARSGKYNEFRSIGKY